MLQVVEELWCKAELMPSVRDGGGGGLVINRMAVVSFSTQS
jgi:hypothetical protein